MNIAPLAHRYRIRNGRHFKLAEVDPGDTWKIKSKEHAQEWLEKGVARMSELQSLLYAAGQRALLLVFQAMDAAGKDSTIKHVMSGINPQGCQVFSFKAPSAEELRHDYLWRTNRCLPERGRIGIFNRSYYEEVLIVRVHPELLEYQNLPPALTAKDIWQRRFNDINALERHLHRSGTVIRKFFLHVSRDEQRERFLDRLEDPEKLWKFSAGDLEERKRWKDYMTAYEDMVQHTAKPHAPWYVVPADHKWFTRLVVAEVIIETLESLKLKYPSVNAAKRKELAVLRRSLIAAK